MMFNRTLLQEEGDEGAIVDKKKREKGEKYADADRRKKLGNRKTSPAPDVYYNSAVTGMSPTGNMDDMTSVSQVPSIPPPPGQQAHQQQQKITRQHVPQIPAPAAHQHAPVPGQQHVTTQTHQQHSQQILLPPPPTLQHRTTVQHQQQGLPHSEPVYQPLPDPHGTLPQGQLPYSGHPPPQMNYPGVQYAATPQPTVPQVPTYGNPAATMPHMAAQRQASAPATQPAHEYPAQHGQPLRQASLPESPSPITESHDMSWNAAAESDQDLWRAPNRAGVTGTWAAFSPITSPDELPGNHELDEEHSSSEDEDDDDDDDDRSTSPVLLGEEGEGLLRAPSLTSFAESISSVEEESEDNVWRIQPDQRDYYIKQFHRLQPVDGGLVKGPKARDFFMKSMLPTDTLSKIWHLADMNKDNALNLDEFCIAMHLVVALRHGLELPDTLPSVLVPEKKEPVDPFSVPTSDRPAPPAESRPPAAIAADSVFHRQLSSPEEPGPGRFLRQDSSEEYVTKRRSYSEASSTDESVEMPHRRVSVPATHMHHSQVTDYSQIPAGPLSPGHTGTSEIARPRAVAKPSLLDAAPGQLLPPPSGKQAREGWTPVKPGQFVVKATASPLVPHQMSPPSSPMSTPPTSPLHPAQTPPPPDSPEPSGSEEVDQNKEEDDAAKVQRRASRRSGERPRSTGDVNKIVAAPVSSSGSGSADGKKGPPPPPPRKKGHSRASSLDLNKLFAAKAKENRGTSSASSNSSSHSSQQSDGPIPEVKPTDSSRPRSPADEQEGAASPAERPATPSQENFADFSKFDNFVMAQGTATEPKARRGAHGPVEASGRPHRRSLSLDFDQVSLSKEAAHPPNRGPPSQEALPRPVPKKKPQSPPALKLKKLDRTSERDSEKERRLKTEPPKVVVRPLTKEDKLQTEIRDLKEKNATLSRLNSSLQQELKEAMEARMSLEVKLERLRPFTPPQ